MESLEARCLLAGDIQGTLWYDLDANGEIGASEQRLEGWTVYIDQDRNGVFDPASEPSTVTDQDGSYAFTGLADGSYVIGQVTPDGWQQVSPIGRELLGGNAPSDPNASGVALLSQITPAGFGDGSTTGNDITSYVSPSGREYAIVGLRKSVAFVEVTAPSSPIIVDVISGFDEPSGSEIGVHHDDINKGLASAWRDMKTFGEYAYAVTEGGGGIQIFDLSQIDGGVVSVVNSVNSVGPSRSHNVSINTDSGYLYTTGSSGVSGLQIFDLNADPENPPLVGTWNVRYLHDAQVVSYTDGPFAGREIAFGFGEGSGIYVIDVTDKSNVFTVAQRSYSGVQYAHNGALSEDLQYLFVNDELDEARASVSSTTTYVFDVSDINNPTYLTSFTNGLPAIDHNPMVRGGFIFEANYRSGLRIWDISNPMNAQESGYYDTYPGSDSAQFSGAWGVDTKLPSGTVIVSDIEGGLFVFDATWATVPTGSYHATIDLQTSVFQADFGSRLESDAPFSQIIDDGDSGFSTVGNWLNWASEGYQSDLKYLSSGTVSDMATWTFTGLAAGTYEVSAHWWEHPNRATNAQYTILDDTTQVAGPIAVNQQVIPNADHSEGGIEFQILASSVQIDSGTLVVQLPHGANGTLVADAVRVELVAPAGPDTTPPTADLSSPTSGGTIAPAVLNAQGYLAVTYADVGDGLNHAFIDGNELSISGAGAAGVTLAGTAERQGQTNTYHYAFTGTFVAGQVDVTFVADTFQDLASTPNQNLEETESFAVQAAPFSQIIDDGDSGFSTVGNWLNWASEGYQSDLKYLSSGTVSDMATWTFTGLAAGTYEVSAHWWEHPNRATNAQYTILDDTTQVAGPIAVNQQVIPNADHSEGGIEFQILASSVQIDSGTLVVQLPHGANGTLVADAVRVELVAPAGPDTTPPTADLSSPTSGGTIAPAVLNAQGYLAVTYADVGDGLNHAFIDGNELSISGAGAAGVTLAGTAERQGQTNTYHYAFTGTFVAGQVDVTFVADTFQDLASTPNQNLEETESFAVQAAPFSQIIDDGDSGFSTVGNWLNWASEGYQSDLKYLSSGTVSDMATWTFTGLAAGTYEVSAHWWEHPNRATNAQYTILDDTTQVAGPIAVNQQVIPNADHSEGGIEFQILASSVQIDSGTLVVQLPHGANGTLVADAVRVELVAPAGPDTTPPTADLSSPTSGGTIAPAVLNAQGYLAVTYADVGDGLNHAFIDGNELSISGAGAAGVTLAGTAERQGQTNTYHYAFTGTFVAGQVDVTFVADTFQDLASTPNQNLEETESFAVQAAPFSQIIDDGDSGFSTVGNWLNWASEGYQSDLKYLSSGTVSDMATWTYTGLAAGTYEVSAHWWEHPNRATNAQYTILDDTTQVAGPIAVNQQVIPNADHSEGGIEFQILASSVQIDSGTLVVQPPHGANGTLVADAVRVELVAPAGPDTTPPTADLSSPTSGGTIAPAVLNAQGYLAVTYADVGDGLNHAFIDGNELSISGAGAAGVTLAGTAERQGQTNTYHYAFTGTFVAGQVDVTFVADTFQDLASTPNQNLEETESFAVQAAPFSQIIDDGDSGFSTVGNWLNWASEGYQSDLKYLSSGTVSDMATWTFTGLAAGTYEVSAHWWEHPNRATNAQYTILDDTTQVAGPIAVNQQVIPNADHSEGGIEFQILASSVQIDSGTLVVQLPHGANGTLVADAVRVELVGDLPLGQISGTVFNDTDGDGVIDAGESPLEGWILFLDQDQDGVRDAGEEFTTSDSNGQYSFNNLSDGTYYVAEILPTGWEQTFPTVGGSSAGAGGGGAGATQTFVVESGVTYATSVVDVTADYPSDLVASITTTASDAPVYAIGQVVESQFDVTPSTDESGALINLPAFQADVRFAGIDGSGVAVVILDTGIDLDHSFFGPDNNSDGVADRIVFSADYTNEGDGTAQDQDGHGSNVSSIVGSENSTYPGVAPGVDIIHLQVLDSGGSGSFAWIEQALQWVVSNVSTYNIVAVNMSLGDSANHNTTWTTGLSDELAALSALDVITVSAAGNDFHAHGSQQGVSSPAADPNSLAIGAVYDANIGGVGYSGGATAFSTTADAIAPFSQRSTVHPTIFAPGAAITGANWNENIGNGTVTMHGTSQASPQVAGVAALAQQLALQSIGRRLTTTEFENLLLTTGVTINDGDNENDNVTNTGEDFVRVDMFALGEAILGLGSAGPGVHQVDIVSEQVVTGINFGNRPLPVTEDHGNDAGSSTAVSVPSSTLGDLETSTDVDWFNFTAVAGTDYVLQTSLITLSDSTLTLYDTNGTSQLASNDDYPGLGLASRIDWTAPANGTYYAAVAQYSTETGTYTLNISTGAGGSSSSSGSSFGAQEAFDVSRLNRIDHSFLGSEIGRHTSSSFDRQISPALKIAPSPTTGTDSSAVDMAIAQIYHTDDGMDDTAWSLGHVSSDDRKPEDAETSAEEFELSAEAIDQWHEILARLSSHLAARKR